ncbi:hypothetical protein COV12_00905 [Candidatus Woesearchaeota archaeon CG10_big_fil_rev_8_21_14_0_10_32_24]|nr:MAG: hypothetical protein COV12_00905 [Candidatus Woesearchaeota archaeon CG10_big_fil_rev_8_21_14_0_10_32_24]
MIKRNVALIVLYNKDRKILLQHRAKDAERLPDYWAFFGGGIDGEETPEQTVYRETFEELNYQLKNPRLILTQKFKTTRHEGTKYVFVEEYDALQNLKLQEGQDWGWYQISETDSLKIVDHDRKVLEKIVGKF